MKKRTFVLPLLAGLLCLSTGSFAQKRILNICVLHPPKLSTNLQLDQVIYFPNTAKSKKVTITNTSTEPQTLGKIFLDDIDADQFELHDANVVVTKGGAPQPPEQCSNRTLPAGGKCSFRVVLLNNSPATLYAMLHVPTKVPCELRIPVRELFQIQ